MYSKFWLEADGDDCFASWLRQVDQFTQRFLDIELLTMTETLRIDPRDAYEDGQRPGAYFLELLHEVRAENSTDMIDSLVARNVKFGGLER